MPVVRIDHFDAERRAVVPRNFDDPTLLWGTPAGFVHPTGVEELFFLGGCVFMRSEAGSMYYLHKILGGDQRESPLKIFLREGLQHRWFYVRGADE